MKHRAIVLALASACATFSSGAHATDDFCSRLIIQVVQQVCQFLPNGLALCQPVALLSPDPNCATPAPPISIPLAPPSVQAVLPWAAPTYPNFAMPALPPVTLPALPLPAMPLPASPLPPSPGTPALPRIMAAAPQPAQVKAPVETPAAQPPAPPSMISPAAVVSEQTPPTKVLELPVAASLPAAAEITLRAEAAPTPAPETAAADVVASTASAATVPAQAVDAPPAPPPEIPAAAQISVAPTPPLSETSTPGETEKTLEALAHFDFDSAELNAAGRAVLDTWVASAAKDASIRVSGHADRLGPEPYNLKLSLRRAEAVKRYLLDKGMQPSRIQIEALGESQPVKRCRGGPTPATKDCLAPNRRVVIDP